MDPGEWTGTHAGRPGVCRLNGRLLARNVLNMLLGGLCSVPERPAGHLVRVLPTMLQDSEADGMVKGLVRQVRFSVLDGGLSRPRLRSATGAEGEQGGSDRGTRIEVPGVGGGNESGRTGASAHTMHPTECARAESCQSEVGAGLRFRWASRRTWPKMESGQWAIAEVRLR